MPNINKTPEQIEAETLAVQMGGVAFAFGVGRCLHTFLERPKMGQPDAEKLKALEGQDGYLTWHCGRLCDGERLLSGRAIGSCRVEGACKHLIGVWLKQSGARWRKDRINRMDVICSLFYASGRTSVP